MPLETPRLDDRTFDDLLAAAKRRIGEQSPTWTDRSDGDPGIVLLELFAFLTETMIYRLNRVPEKVYVELLRLMGVTLAPPAAARAELTFTRVPGRQGRIDIPRGTRVGAARSDSAAEPIIFATVADAHIADGVDDVTVGALHTELVAAEYLGAASGMAGTTVALRRPPVIAATGDGGDLVIAVELSAADDKPVAGDLEHDGQRYRVWHEVDTFVGRSEEFVYRADRQAGLIHFAPALRRRDRDGVLDEVQRPLAKVPATGRRILAWYRRGGGSSGNVAAGSLTVLKDPVPGVGVVNLSPAQGGREAESLENALARGPQEIHSLQRAVTARDYEFVALNSDRAVARALAVTSADYWRHARPGEAEVVLVPAVASEGPVTADGLRALESPAVARRVLEELDRRRPLGSTCRVNWVKYKSVRVSARVVVQQHEDLAHLGTRVLGRLHDTISPLASEKLSGWEFGKTLRASHIYEIALREPGVVWVDRVRLHLEEVPSGDVPAVVAAPTQPGIWYAGAATGVFRTINDGVGWEPLAAGQLAASERVVKVCAHPTQAGLLAVITRLEPRGEVEPSGGVEPSDAVEASGEVEAPVRQSARSRVLLSRTAGEDWAPHPHDLAFEVEDAAWLHTDTSETLLLATDVGLFRLSSREGAAPELVPVAGQRQDLPLYAVASGAAGEGNAYVAVAAQRSAGVFLAVGFQENRGFRRIDELSANPIAGEDVRVLAIQRDAGASFLWAGITAHGRNDPGKGCFRWRLRGEQDAPEGWQPFSGDWRAGSCLGLSFIGALVFAATYRRGVVRLDTRSPTPSWTFDINAGLPLTGDDDFPVEPVVSVASQATGSGEVVMAGTASGVFRSRDSGASYVTASGSVFLDKVTLPPTWLFCSGEHELDVVRADEAQERDEDEAEAGEDDTR